MLVEPPGEVLPAGPPERRLTLRHVRFAAAAVAGLLALTSTGPVLLVAALLAVAAFDVMAGVAAVLVAFSVVARWGTWSLGPVAGAQSVLGPALATGSTVRAFSSLCAGLALVLIASEDDDVPLPVAAGIAAAAIAAGPALGDRPALRIVMTLVAVGLAFAAARFVMRVPGRGAAVALGALAWLLVLF